MKVKAVVFDYGGVLTSVSMPIRVREAVEARGLPWAAVEDGFARWRGEYDRGTLSLSGFYDRIWSAAGCDVAPEVRREIEEADNASWLYRNERTLAWMRELRAGGFRLGILTNMPATYAPVFRGHFADFVAEAEALVISGEVGTVKPDPAIYAIMRGRLGLEPGEICFVDDNAKNVEGARACGWRAIRFESNAQVEREFAALAEAED